MVDFTNSHLLGLVPSFFREDDARPAREQLAERYAHGGGGQYALTGFVLKNPDIADGSRLIYPADEDGPDEVYREVGRGRLRDELLVMYDHQWLAIIQKDRSFVVLRVA